MQAKLRAASRFYARLASRSAPLRRGAIQLVCLRARTFRRKSADRYKFSSFSRSPCNTLATLNERCARTPLSIFAREIFAREISRRTSLGAQTRGNARSLKRRAAEGERERPLSDGIPKSKDVYFLRHSRLVMRRYVCCSSVCSVSITRRLYLSLR